MFMSEIYSYETSEQVENVGQPYYWMVLEGQNSVVRVDATTITREQMAAIVGPENVGLFPPVMS